MICCKEKVVGLVRFFGKKWKVFFLGLRVAILRTFMYRFVLLEYISVFVK